MREKIFDILDELDISYKNFEHEPTFTCEESKGVELPGKRVKSLLLKNKNKTNFYMVVIEDEKRLDSNKIRKLFGESKISFVSEELMVEKIGVRPGYVSPFALIHNIQRDITVVIDKELENHEIGIHPLQNDNTIVIHTKDVLKFINKFQNKNIFLEL